MDTYSGLRLGVGATILTALSAVGACSGGDSGSAQSRAAAAMPADLLGDYGGEECLYSKLTLSQNGTAYMTVFGTDQAGQYSLDGDRVILTTGGQSAVFTRNGRNLESNLLGDRMVCAPLTSDGQSQIYEATLDQGRISLELGAGGQGRMTMHNTSDPNAPDNMSFSVRYQTAADSVTVEIPGDEPMRLVRNGRDLVATRDGETVRFVGR